MRALVAILTLAFAAPAAAHPCPDATPKTKTVTKRPARPRPARATAPASPTAEHIMQLYKHTGTSLATVRNNPAADPLMMRYRLINIADVLANPSKRSDAVTTLDKINADIKKLVP